MMKALAAAVVIASVFLAELWFGEDGSTALPRLLGGALSFSLAFALVWWLAHRAGRLPRLVGATTCVAAALLGFVAGDREQQRAYNECVGRGEEIRSQLKTYWQREGRYPDRLDLAIDRDRLCNRALRGSLLTYSATPSTYRLEFGDYLVSWRASERDPFVATK